MTRSGEHRGRIALWVALVPIGLALVAAQGVALSWVLFPLGPVDIPFVFMGFGTLAALVFVAPVLVLVAVGLAVWSLARDTSAGVRRGVIGGAIAVVEGGIYGVALPTLMAFAPVVHSTP